MKIILLKKCKQGNIGDVINVKNGFARNKLIPEGTAQRATPEVMKEFEQKRQELEMLEKQLLSNAEVTRNQLGVVSITLVREASRDMKLYGAISKRDIAEAINDKYGVLIDSEKVIILNRIKEVGVRNDVQIKLHHDVIVPVELNVLPQESK